MNKPRTKNRKRRVAPVTFETVRELALALPGVKEGTSYRTTAFKVNGRLLARFHQDGETLVVKCEFAAREVLMGVNPTTFYLNDHYRCWPWVLVRVSNVHLDELRGLLEDAWRASASKRARLAWDTNHGR
ncbi:MAG: MmcQ/YjbR family DNA-binding protein [Acidobacteriota bacterium]